MKQLQKVQLILYIAGISLVASCGGPSVRMPVDMIPEACEVWPGPVRVSDLITIALSHTVEPRRAPWARNAGELLLYRHLYEPLINIDCFGQVRPGLATAWKKEDRGRRWVFELREDARFWDGTAVTARDVAESWLDTAVRPVTRGAGIDSTVVEGDRILHVCFNRSFKDVPRMLSDLAFSVTKPPVDSSWPVGSGPYRIAGSEGERFKPFGGAIEMIPALGTRGPVIHCLVSLDGDARDLIDRGADVTITADPDVIEYATGRPELETLPLPWDRTYVLLSTSRAQAVRRGKKLPKVPDELSDGMARDAVRQDARGSRPPFWWKEAENCSGGRDYDARFLKVPRGASPSSGVRRILYDSSDPVARDLAERIVALAATPPDKSQDAAAVGAAIPGLTDKTFGVIADGVTSQNLENSLFDGEDFAYIVAVPSRPADLCHEKQKMTSRAPWLIALEEDYSKAIIPLVDTRLHAILNNTRVGLALDYYGVFLLLEEISRGDDPS